MKEGKLKLEKIQLILLFSIVFIALFQAMNKSETKKIYFKDINILNFIDNNKGYLTLIYIINPRSIQSLDFVSEVSNYVKKNQLNINTGLILTYKDDNDVIKKRYENSGILEIYDKEKFNEISYSNNSYYLFNKSGILVKRGFLNEFPNLLMGNIDVLLGIDLNFNLADYISLNTSFDKSIFSDTIQKNNIFKKHNCIIISDENLCLGCRSGILLMEFEKLKRVYLDYGFSLITLYAYNEKDIKRIKRNNSLKINILIAEEDLKQVWIKIGKKTNLDHPLNGLIFVIDQEGIIKLVTKKIDILKKWLEGGSNLIKEVKK